MEDLRYPIGKFSPQEVYSSPEIAQFINRIEALPQKLADAIHNLNEEQLNTPYRDGGWTVRQVVHHLADSHMHAYIRTKWVLTETEPVIKAYLEKFWAETPETKTSPEISLSLLKVLHTKWAILLRTVSQTDLLKFFVHPETKKHVSLGSLMGTYAWHGEHHLAQINNLKQRVFKSRQ